MSTEWKMKRYPATGQTEWRKPGFIITKESGYTGFTMQTLSGAGVLNTGVEPSWPLRFATLTEAMEAATWSWELIRDVQRQAYFERHHYFALIKLGSFNHPNLGEEIMGRIWNDALEEDAYRTQVAALRPAA